MWKQHAEAFAQPRDATGWDDGGDDDEVTVTDV